MATGTVFDVSLQNAVTRTRDAHVAAVNGGSVEAAASLFDDSAIFLPPGQSVLEGPAIRGWFTYVFTNFAIRDFALQPGELSEHGDMAIEHGIWTATFLPKNGGSEISAGGTYLTVYVRKADGSARIARDCFNGLPG